MICLKDSRQGAEILMDYCAGALDAIRAAELENHLHECAACRNEVEAQREVWDALDAWTPVEASADFDAKLYARIAAENRQPWWHRLFWKPAVPLAAAAAVLMVALVLWIPGWNGRIQSTPVSPNAAEKIDLQQVEQALDDMDMLTPVNQTARAL